MASASLINATDIRPAAGRTVLIRNLPPEAYAKLQRIAAARRMTYAGVVAELLRKANG